VAFAYIYVALSITKFCVEITKPHNSPFIVSTTVYRPPNASSHFFEHSEKLIKQIDDEEKEMYLIGHE
jgi:hypothetical protein